MGKIKKLSPGRIIALGFLFVILIGAILLLLPITHNRGVHVHFIDALFTSTSAVCVTGLIAIDTRDTFNVLGQLVVMLLIQIGGLGVTSVGVGFVILAGKKVGIKERILVKEALNLDSMKGVVKIVKSILLLTLCFESIGAFLSFLVFSKDYKPVHALWISIFHSVASFNNAGFDILGGFKNLLDYKKNILLNLTTCFLIIFGGLGFITIKELILKKNFKSLSLNSKIVIVTTIFLLVCGTILIKVTERITWIGAFFFSTSARTAGFSTYPLGTFNNASLFIIIILMFIGASPGSTGGGIKTTTAFTLFKSVLGVSTNKHCSAFKRHISEEITAKAFIITLLAAVVICLGTLLLCVLQKQYSFMQIMFEVTSAFGTVGLSTGITPTLCWLSKFILVIIMFIGRLGPLTIATIWYFKPTSNVSYSSESVTIG